MLMEIYHKLLEHFGPQGWWPGESPFEIMVGAILTQNANWRNVERAIENLKKQNLLSCEKIHRLPPEKLAELIRPSGFYNLKAKRLKKFVEYFFEKYGGDAERMKKMDGEKLRKELLSLPGIGKETADSILLYAIEKPFFVVDAYTRRFLSRHGIMDYHEDYDKIRLFFERNIPRDVYIYNEYHALLVRLGKTNCRKKEECEKCPLRSYLPENRE